MKNLADFEKKRDMLSANVDIIKKDLEGHVCIKSNNSYIKYHFDEDSIIHDEFKKFLSEGLERMEGELKIINEKIEACKVLLR